jgi:hypothetical protein
MTTTTTKSSATAPAASAARTDSTFQRALIKLLTEIFDGPPGDEAYVLNPREPGLLAMLDSIDAAAASARSFPGKTTVAAHADHLHYGLTLLNRWAAGEENPWADSDWTASWRRGTVNAEQWKTLRENLRREADTWKKAAAAWSDWTDMAAAGALSSVAHTAYHLGAIRQILAAQGKWSA